MNRFYSVVAAVMVILVMGCSRTRENPPLSPDTSDTEPAPTVQSELTDTISRPTAAPSISAFTPTLSLSQSLRPLLEKVIQQNNFDGLMDLYFLDLQSDQELHFAFLAGRELSIHPDIAFSAARTIKLPIMVSTYIFYNGQLDEPTAALVNKAVAIGGNTEADQLLEAIDPKKGPLVVTETMQKLGLENTFLAGYFKPGAALLEMFTTPANSRTDISTNPDTYAQTTPADMGLLLEDIYRCAQSGEGALMEAFPGRISRDDCQQMIQTMSQNELEALLWKGIPEGTVMADMSAWLTEINGVMHEVADTAIIYSPGGNYILTLFTYHPDQIIWEDSTAHPGVNSLFADLSRAVYKFMNPSAP